MKNGWSVIGLEDAALYIHMEAEQGSPTGGAHSASLQLGVSTPLAGRK